MPQFDVVFEKLELALREDHGKAVSEGVAEVSPIELDEIEELRRFSAEIQAPEPAAFTTT